MSQSEDPQARAQRIVAAVKELHEACHDAWSTDDDAALATSYAILDTLKQRTLVRGREVDGWSGGVLFQSDAVVSALRLLECYGSHLKGEPDA